MKFFESILSNIWVVGIITGLFVFFITDLISRFREKREYYRRLVLANNEILSTLKLVIPEKNLPNKNILISLHKATANKYDVKIKDIDSLATILDKLIKEIIDSSFLVYKDKIDYSNSVNDLKNKLNNIIEIEDVKSGTLEFDESRYYGIMIRHQRRIMIALFIPVFSLTYFLLFDSIKEKGIAKDSLIMVVYVVFLIGWMLLLIKASARIRDRSLKRKSLDYTKKIE